MPSLHCVHSARHRVADSHQLHNDNVIHVPLVTLNAVLQKELQIAVVVWIAAPIEVDDQSPWITQESNRTS